MYSIADTPSRVPYLTDGTVTSAAGVLYTTTALIPIHAFTDVRGPLGETHCGIKGNTQAKTTYRPMLCVL